MPSKICSVLNVLKMREVMLNQTSLPLQNKELEPTEPFNSNALAIKIWESILIVWTDSMRPIKQCLFPPMDKILGTLDCLDGP